MLLKISNYNRPIPKISASLSFPWLIPLSQPALASWHGVDHFHIPCPRGSTLVFGDFTPVDLSINLDSDLRRLSCEPSLDCIDAIPDSSLCSVVPFPYSSVPHFSNVVDSDATSHLPSGGLIHPIPIPNALSIQDSTSHPLASFDLGTPGAANRHGSSIDCSHLTLIGRKLKAFDININSKFDFVSFSVLTGHILPHLEIEAIDFSTLDHRTCTYNTHGACGDIIWSDPAQAASKARAVQKLLLNHSATHLQETHADDFEIEKFRTNWSHTHIVHNSNGLSRNEGGLISAYTHKFVSNFDIIFQVDLIPGRALASFFLSKT